MRTSALVQFSTALAVAAATVIITGSGAQAALPDPAAPVVTDDAVAVYPLGMTVVDVLANDTDPGDSDGSQLALCRLPGVDLSNVLTASGLPSVVVGDAGGLFGPRGDLLVMATRARLRKPVEVDYYVCNTTHLTPATLTVTLRATKPVTVHKIPGRPGRLKVVNHNDRRIVLAWHGPRFSGAMRIGADSTRIIRVRGKAVKWQALIGTARSNGVAGQGMVRDIEIDPRDDGKPTKGDLVEIPGIFRPLLQRLR